MYGALLPNQMDNLLYSYSHRPRHRDKLLSVETLLRRLHLARSVDVHARKKPLPGQPRQRLKQLKMVCQFQAPTPDKHPLIPI